MSSLVYIVRRRSSNRSDLVGWSGSKLLCRGGIAKAYRTKIEIEFRTSRTRLGTVEDKILGIRGGAGAGNDLANDNLVLLN